MGSAQFDIKCVNCNNIAFADSLYKRGDMIVKCEHCGFCKKVEFIAEKTLKNGEKIRKWDVNET